MRPARQCRVVGSIRHCRSPRLSELWNERFLNEVARRDEIAALTERNAVAIFLAGPEPFQSTMYARRGARTSGSSPSTSRTTSRCRVWIPVRLRLASHITLGVSRTTRVRNSEVGPSIRTGSMRRQSNFWRDCRRGLRRGGSVWLSTAALWRSRGALWRPLRIICRGRPLTRAEAGQWQTKVPRLPRRN